MYLTKTSRAIIVLENYFQIIQIILEINHLITQTTDDNQRSKKIHIISHKTVIVDQIIEIISTEITIQDRIEADQNFCLKPNPIHSLGIDTIPMIDQETLHIIEIEIIPTIGKQFIQMIETKGIKTKDHVINLTTDQIIKN